MSNFGQIFSKISRRFVCPYAAGQVKLSYNIAQSKFMMPQIINYKGLRAFLKDYISFKRQQNPNWSLGVWANQLGVSSASVIARISNGTRPITDNLIERMKNFFSFTELEQEYFELLCKKDSQRLSSSLQMLFEERMEQLKRQYHWVSSPKVNNMPTSEEKLLNMIKIEKGRALHLYGEGDFEIADQLLKHENIEPLATNNGKVNLGIGLCHYPDTSLGAYNDFWISFFVQSREEGPNSIGIYYLYPYTNNLEAKTFWLVCFGQPYSHGIIEENSSDQGRVLSLSNEKKTLLKLVKHETGKHLDSQSYSDCYRIYSPRLGRVLSYQIQANFSSIMSPFNTHKDQITWDKGGAIGQFLSKIHFSPSYWSEVTNLSAKIFDPQISF